MSTIRNMSIVRTVRVILASLILPSLGFAGLTACDSPSTVGGSTGEGPLLSTDERMAVAGAYVAAAAGRLPVDRLISRRGMALNDLGAALDDLHTGDAIRQIIEPHV